ncbi:MAG TPA: thiamine phosphate synthase [Thermodesulfovibrionales bacterium]|jgi:thiamine-phosphate pyrophosphorylase|nr:thiamine phosphate synthase [Thermodesulfovibrionales bacterium]
MKKFADIELYLITDRRIFADSSLLFSAIEEALEGGVKAIQLREKDLPIRELLSMAYHVRELTDRYSARLFINDRVDVAVAVWADGVHLGQGSMPASAAKKVSRELLVGVSTHSLEEAMDAEKEGADFVTFGPVYPTPSKIQYGEPVGIEALRRVCSGVSLPVLAIGGVTAERIREVRSSRADGVAVISAVLGSPMIKQTTERFLRCLHDKN